MRLCVAKVGPCRNEYSESDFELISQHPFLSQGVAPGVGTIPPLRFLLRCQASHLLRFETQIRGATPVAAGSLLPFGDASYCILPSSHLERKHTLFPLCWKNDPNLRPKNLFLTPAGIEHEALPPLNASLPPKPVLQKWALVGTSTPRVISSSYHNIPSSPRGLRRGWGQSHPFGFCFGARHRTSCDLKLRSGVPPPLPQDHSCHSEMLPTAYFRALTLRGS